jgi:phage shock protein E
MTWLSWLVVGGVVAALLILKRLALVRPEVARDWLKRGAKVIDVRSETEYQERHLPEAINIPVTRLSEAIGRHIPDKAQPILLHCLSGGRSGIGQGTLRRMGYRNTFNLGSYARAEKILAR